MKEYTFIGKLTRYEHRNCSVYGNPRYYGIFEDADGNWIEATTASNAACAYGFLNYPDSMRKITYHITKKGGTCVPLYKIMPPLQP